MSESTPLSETQKAVEAIKEGHPATDLVKVLLKHLAIDLPSYKRNVFSSAAILKHTNYVYERILELIDQVQRAMDTPAWEAFEKYTQAIVPLEDLLLSLALEGNELPHVPPVGGLIASFTFLENWKNDRNTAIDALDKLGPQHFKDLHDPGMRTGILEGRRQDDVSTLRDLANNAASSQLKDEAIIDLPPNTKFVTNVKAILENIKTTVSAASYTYDEGRVGKVVFSVMLAYIPFAVVEFPDLDGKTEEHIKSAAIWQDLEAFANSIKSFVDDSNVPVATLEEKCKVIEQKLLLMPIGPFTSQLVGLMKLAAQVRRPMYGRSVVLIQMWYLLNGKEKTKAENSRRARSTLRNTFTLTRDTLDRARQELTNVESDLSEKITEVEAKYTSLIPKIAVMFEKYADAGEWTKYKEMYDDAESTDKDHISRFQDKLAKRNSTKPEA